MTCGPRNWLSKLWQAKQSGCKKGKDLDGDLQFFFVHSEDLDGDMQFRFKGSKELRVGQRP